MSSELAVKYYLCTMGVHKVFVIRGGSKMKALTVMCNQTELYLWPEYIFSLYVIITNRKGEEVEG